MKTRLVILRWCHLRSLIRDRMLNFFATCSTTRNKNLDREVGDYGFRPEGLKGGDQESHGKGSEDDDGARRTVSRDRIGHDRNEVVA